MAWRKTYCDPSWIWAIDGNLDVETIVVQKTGHGLSQAHFGQLFRTNRNGRFHFPPRALMNAGYTGIQQELLGTNRGGHCSTWAS